MNDLTREDDKSRIRHFTSRTNNMVSSGPPQRNRAIDIPNAVAIHAGSCWYSPPVREMPSACPIRSATTDAGPS